MLCYSNVFQIIVRMARRTGGLPSFSNWLGRNRGGGGLSDGNIRDMLDEDSGESDLEDLTGRESGWNEDDDRNVSDMEVDDNGGGDGDLDDQNNTVVQPDNALDLTDDEDEEGEEGEEGDERGGDEVGEDDLGPVQGEHRRVRPTFSKRLVNCLDSCLDPANFDRFEIPTEKKEYSVVMEKKTRNKPEKKISWKNTPVTRRGRQGRENILLSPGGVKSAAARSADTPLKCFDLFFTPEMIRICTEKTNQNIDARMNSLPVERQARIRESDKYPWMKKLDCVMMRAYLGLCFLRGLYKQNHWSAERIWEDRIGHPVFRATMSYNRFMFISSNFCMDDVSTRDERWKNDRFAAAREVWELFNDACSLAVEAGEYVTIDESLYQARTKVSFKQYNSSKPAKYGILVKCLNSVRWPYSLHPQVRAICWKASRGWTSLHLKN